MPKFKITVSDDGGSVDTRVATMANGDRFATIEIGALTFYVAGVGEPSAERCQAIARAFHLAALELVRPPTAPPPKGETGRELTGTAAITAISKRFDERAADAHRRSFDQSTSEDERNIQIGIAAAFRSAARELDPARADGSCPGDSPPWFSGRWRDWHRGHGCEKDDGRPRSAEAIEEIKRHEARA
jgi:hypothetical protein